MGLNNQKIILVTAFEPFGGETMNPTEMILNRLPDMIGSHRIRKVLLPVEFERASALALDMYDIFSPDAVLMLGQAAGRSAVTPETTAKNIMNATIPDNAGFQPRELPIRKSRASALYSTLPLESICEVINALGIPCEVSDDAGEFVCNTLFYRMLHHASRKIPTGFIHVPCIREQGHADQPFMEFEDEYRAIAAAIETISRIISC